MNTDKAISSKEDEEFYNAMKAWDAYKLKRAKKALFEKHSLDPEIRDCRFYTRWFCWVKTWICLMLNRTNGSYLDDNTVCILSYDEHSCYESQSWDAVWVSTKLFSGWQVCVSTDGT